MTSVKFALVFIKYVIKLQLNFDTYFSEWLASFNFSQISNFLVWVAQYIIGYLLKIDVLVDKSCNGFVVNADS